MAKLTNEELADLQHYAKTRMYDVENLKEFMTDKERQTCIDVFGDYILEHRISSHREPQKFYAMTKMHSIWKQEEEISEQSAKEMLEIFQKFKGMMNLLLKRDKLSSWDMIVNALRNDLFVVYKKVSRKQLLDFLCRQGNSRNYVHHRLIPDLVKKEVLKKVIDGRKRYYCLIVGGEK